ncbi:hypothetical protein VMCG_02715 [Cytospora schulzeri]|uniref:Uncharacterized protein n=1 Tax=Cytospora schulzeri TaxID=448051 RepID=A0A423WZN2_9PEZI|nr:hypothetical protein VMCG_02715 [Valsa malicola]
MAQPWEATSSNNPFRASMMSQRTSMAPQRTSFKPERRSYLLEDPFEDDYEESPPSYQPYRYSGTSVAPVQRVSIIPERNSYLIGDPFDDDYEQTTPSYQPYRSSRMSMAPAQRMSSISEMSSSSDVPSLDVSEQSWDDPSPSTPDDVSDDSYFKTSSREVPETGTPVTPKRDIWGVPEPPQYTSKRVLRKIKRLVKTRAKEIETIAVFNSDDKIVCFHESPGAVKQQYRYIPEPDEGKYVRLALERGFKQEGCQFDFGTVTWLSGKQEEVDEKRTLLGSTANDPQAGNHQFYGVLSPTGRYVFAAILKETPSGTVSPKVMRKIRVLADKMEVYEAWAGSGGIMAKIAAKL